MTWPPRRLRAAIVSRNAPVHSFVPSPTAPKLVRGKNRSGKPGRLTDRTIRSAALSAALSTAPPAALAPRPGEFNPADVARAADALPAAEARAASSGAASAPAPVTADRRSIARRSISWDIFVLPPIDRTVPASGRGRRSGHAARCRGNQGGTRPGGKLS